jgi:hypothetical protein
MATWKRLTGPDGNKVDVNMDMVAYMIRYEDTTRIAFSGGRSDEGNIQIMIVKEKPDEIHMANMLRAL